MQTESRNGADKIGSPFLALCIPASQLFGQSSDRGQLDNRH